MNPTGKQNWTWHKTFKEEICLCRARVFGQTPVSKEMAEWKLTVQAYLSKNLPGEWTKLAGVEDNMLWKWPSHPPDLKPCYLKGLVFVHPLLLIAQTITSRESVPPWRLLPKTCSHVFGRRWTTYLMCAMLQAVCILKSCENVHKIHIHLNFTLF